MKKILFPTDFSKNSENAFLYALDIARIFGAKITTVHTYNAPAIVTTPLVMVEELLDLTEKLEKEEFDKFNDKLRKIAIERGADYVEIDYILECGLAVEEIVRISRKEKTDLIVMGTQGANGLGRWLFGSNAASVVERSYCPVMVIPEDATYRPIERITYATNFDESDDRILANVLNWSTAFNAELHLIHVSSRGEYIHKSQYERMREYSSISERYDNVKFKVLYDSELLDEIEDYVADNAVDLLVMLSHHYPFYKRLFNPSISKQMAFETEIPLLVYYDKD